MLKQSLSDNPIITSRFRVFGVLDRVVESLSGVVVESLSGVVSLRSGACFLIEDRDKWLLEVLRCTALQ